MNTDHILGNSIAQGSGASVPANAWAKKLETATGRTTINHAYGGDMACDLTRTDPSGTAQRRLYSIALGATDRAFIQTMENDARIYGPDAAKLAYSRNALLNAGAWLGLPVKTTARAIGGEVSGVWTDTGIEGIGRRCETAGGKRVVTMSGEDLFFTILSATPGGGMATYSVKIDGGAAHHFDSTAPGITTYNGYPYGQRCHHFGGLSAGPHTVEIEQTSAGYTYHQWFGTNEQVAHPMVVIGDCLRASSAPGIGYAAWGGSPLGVSMACDLVDSVVAELQAAGINAVKAGINAAVNDTTDLHPLDGLHPGDSGHDGIFQTMYLASGGPPLYSYTSLGGVRLRSDGAVVVSLPSGEDFVIGNLP